MKFELTFSDEEMIDFLKGKRYVVGEISGWKPTLGYRACDDGFANTTSLLAYRDFPDHKIKFEKAVEEAGGNLYKLEMKYKLETIFYKEFKKALLKL